MIDTGLKGKVVLITGAQHGIGAATAKAFAAQGASVFIHYLRIPLDTAESKEMEAQGPGSLGRVVYRSRQAMSADEILHDIRARGGRAEAGEADLSRPENIPLPFDQAEKAFGPVQVLVNNAAHWEGDSFLPPAIEPANPLVELWTTRSSQLSAESHDRHFAVNSRAVALMMAEYFRRHVRRASEWGRIVNVSTEGAYCFPGEVSYGASKAALEAYSRSAAYEFARFGITVNIVCPGPTQTGWITPELETRILPTIPLGRLGKPEDVADVIVFLASEQARWLTGQLFNVGGGGKM